MLCFISIMAFGQEVKIIKDEYVEWDFDDQIRKVQTDFIPMAKKRLNEYPFSLQYFKPHSGNKNAFYAIIIKLYAGTSKQSLPRGSKLLLKMDNDSIITLETIIDVSENDKIAGLFIDYYYMYLPYYVTTQQVQQLMTHKVVKIRIQESWDDWYIDLPNKSIKDKHILFTDNLIRMKSSIDTRINPSRKLDEMLNDF